MGEEQMKGFAEGRGGVCTGPTARGESEKKEKKWAGLGEELGLGMECGEPVWIRMVPLAWGSKLSREVLRSSSPMPAS